MKRSTKARIKACARSKRWKDKNPDYQRNYLKTWRENNQDKIKAYQEEYRKLKKAA